MGALRPLIWLTIVSLAIQSDVKSTNATTNSTTNLQTAGAHTTDNASIPLGSFPYIIPYDQDQECDIYGPICLTGSITVGVDLTSATLTSTLPCSSYLAAQSTFLIRNEPHPDALYPFYPTEWARGFGHSPECTSYADAWRRGGEYTFSNCEAGSTIVRPSRASDLPLPSQMPPGVVLKRAFDWYNCCGNCTLQIPEVRFYYFPDDVGNSSCGSNQTSAEASGTKSTVSGNVVKKRFQSFVSKGSTAVLSGRTFTSPSVYLEVVGTAAAKDWCGPIGSTLTNPFITLAPDQLSTYIPPSFLVTVGSKYIDPQADQEFGFLGTVKPLNVRDLECPTFGLGPGTSPNGDVYTTVGPPWLPIIIPPSQALSLDPAWQSLCTGFLSHGAGMDSFAIFDPPRTLSAATYLVPPSPIPTGTDDPKDPPVDPSAPESSLPGPQNVPAPVHSDPNNPAHVSGDGDPTQAGQPAKPAAVPVDPAAKATRAPRPMQPSGAEPGKGTQNDDPTQPSKSGQTNLGAIIFSAFENAAPEPTGQADPVITMNLPTSGTRRITLSNGQILFLGPAQAILDGITFTAGGRPVTLSDGVFSFVKYADNVPFEHNVLPQENSVWEVLGQTVTPNAAGITLAGSALVPGGSAVTVSGIPVSLDPTGVLHAGSSIVSLKLQSVFTVGGQIFTTNPDGFAIDGTHVSPGGSGLTMFGTPVSLDSAGILHVGSSSLFLPPQSVFTVGSQTFTANPTGFAIGSAYIFPGGPAQRVDNETISLDPAGHLHIGSSEFDIASPQRTISDDHAIGSSGILTTEGLIIQPEASAIVVDGITLNPGDPGVSIGGTFVSLESGGTLDVGSDRIAIPTGRLMGTSDVMTFQGAQDKRYQMRRPLLYGGAIAAYLLTVSI